MINIDKDFTCSFSPKNHKMVSSPISDHKHCIDSDFTDVKKEKILFSPKIKTKIVTNDQPFMSPSMIRKQNFIPKDGKKVETTKEMLMEMIKRRRESIFKTILNN